MASVKSCICQLGCSYDQATFDDDNYDCVYCDDEADDNRGNDVEENHDILGVICDVDALSLRWRSPENCHDMFES